MSNFEPAGEKARWKYLYELLRNTNDGGIITYKEMADALGMDPEADRQSIRAAWYRAAKEHEEVDKRAVEVVPNKGYRIVAPKEHLELARKQQKRSGRALVKGQSKVVNVNLSNVDSETRRAFEVVAQMMAQQMDFSRRAEKKLTDHEQLLGTLVEAKERTDAERDEIRERLERLEARLGQ